MIISSSNANASCKLISILNESDIYINSQIIPIARKAKNNIEKKSVFTIEDIEIINNIIDDIKSCENITDENIDMSVVKPQLMALASLMKPLTVNQPDSKQRSIEITSVILGANMAKSSIKNCLNGGCRKQGPGIHMLGQLDVFRAGIFREANNLDYLTLLSNVEIEIEEAKQNSNISSEVITEVEKTFTLLKKCRAKWERKKDKKIFDSYKHCKKATYNLRYVLYDLNRK